jgi:hypothetical protein
MGKLAKSNTQEDYILSLQHNNKKSSSPPKKWQKHTAAGIR